MNDFVEVIGARQNNLRSIDVNIPRNSFVVFTGVSGSGKSSLVFATIYAEAQRRFFDSIAPYARRLIAQLPAPLVADIRGLPPAVALRQNRADPGARSSVGTITRLSNLLRMLFSRCGDYPADLCRRLDSDEFSPNNLSGACPACLGIGITHTVTEASLVPNPHLTIRQKAIAAWPGAWQGKNYRDILATLGYDIDKPWKDLPEKDREWILFTNERPVVTVHAEREAHRIQRPYQGTYMSASAYVRHTFATTNSAALRKRAAKFMVASLCDSCGGKRLKAEALQVKFAGYDIAELMHQPMSRLVETLTKEASAGSNQAIILLLEEIAARISLISQLGLDYLSLDRSATTLSTGELQRLRLIAQIHSGLFGVVYILDEPSAGLHTADAKALVSMLRRLQHSGNSLFVVEHEMDIVRQADWIVDIGPGGGEHGGRLIYSGPPAGLENCQDSITRQYLFSKQPKAVSKSRHPRGWLRLRSITRHNIHNLDVDFPLGVFTAVIGVSGSGKSTLVSEVLVDSVRQQLGQSDRLDDDLQGDLDSVEIDEIAASPATAPSTDEMHVSIEGLESIKRIIAVDQRQIGRTPRSNLATYTGVFDVIRKLFASTRQAKDLKYSAGRFSFNLSGGRCENCQGEGYKSVELMFLPSIYTPCPSCRGARYNSETLTVRYQGKTIAEVLDMTVETASAFFCQHGQLARSFKILCDVGLGYLHLGQPATELSGGEAQRIKLATELQRSAGASRTDSKKALYVIDEPTTGLHPSDTDKLVDLLQSLVDAGNTVIVVEHDRSVINCADYIVELGPGAGIDGGKVISCGAPTTGKSP